MSKNLILLSILVMLFGSIGFSFAQSVPDAPIIVKTAAYTEGMIVVWSEPKSDGGSTITSYDVRYSDDDGTTWITTNSLKLHLNIYNLTNKTDYTVQVRANNAAGSSNWSNSATVTTGLVPDAPIDVHAKPRDGQIFVMCIPPKSIVGLPITSYDIRYSDDGGITWITENSKKLYHIIGVHNKITNGTEYTVQMRANNVNGSGNWSDSVTAIPGTVPGEPTKLRQITNTSSHTRIMLSWNAPSDNGGSSITDYIIKYRSGNGPWIVFQDGENTYTSYVIVSGLTNGTEYQFKVLAVNAFGNSAPSNVLTATPKGGTSAPTNLIATPGDSQVSLSWTTPSDDGGSPILNYLIEYRKSGGYWLLFKNGTSTDTTATIKYLKNGTSYDFRVISSNGIFNSDPSNVVSATPATLPNSPTDLIASLGNNQIELSWKAPSNKGGFPITDYKVEYRTGGSWKTFDDGFGKNRSTTITGLTNGTSYDFRVSAVTSIGTSTPSDILSIKLVWYPDAPTNLKTTSSNGNIKLSWVQPVSDGGSPIIKYVVEYIDNGNTWIKIDDIAPNTTHVDIDSVNGVKYSFKVYATNINGDGTPSEIVTAKSRGPPGPPTEFKISNLNNHYHLFWSAPSSDGGSLLTDYIVEYSADGKNWTKLKFEGNGMYGSYSLDVHLPKNEYTFRVSAVNSVGVGEPIVATGLEYPDAPYNLKAVPGNNYVDLTWDEPAHHGSIIMHYVIWYSSDGNTWLPFYYWEDETNIRVTGLSPNTEYSFKISAKTVAAIEGEPSLVTVTTTLIGVPDEPTNVIATPNDKTVKLSWDAPTYDGGSPITDYIIQHMIGFGLSKPYSDGTNSNTSTTITGLKNGVEYRFVVSAVNTHGIGTPSDEIYITPAKPKTASNAPTNLTVTVGDGQVDLSWITPTNNGGRAITDYHIEYNDGSTWHTFVDGTSTDTTVTVTGLTNGTEYSFRVSAVNLVGISDASSIVTATPQHLHHELIQKIQERIDKATTSGDNKSVNIWNSAIAAISGEDPPDGVKPMTKKKAQNFSNKHESAGRTELANLWQDIAIALR